MADVKIGVFGAFRGNSYIKLIRQEPRTELVAVCDKRLDEMDQDEILKEVPGFKDFDSFIEYGKSVGMNAVFLANYFHQHAPYAIKAMEAGMNVISECTSAGTLKECVELVEAVERTGKKYMIAENYPFMTMNLRMNEIVKSGMLGSLLYAEGEYNHSGPGAKTSPLSPYYYHWRKWLPRPYYITHAMGPLMYMGNCMPKYVSARSVHSDLLYERREYMQNYDGTAIMFCEMDNGMIARFTGCTAMASDYSRYRIVGDRASCETGGNIGKDSVRMFWFEHTKPVDEDECCKVLHADLKQFGERGKAAAEAGHGGGDYWIVQNMVDYFADDKPCFFDVYKGAAMSATAILAWRSCLNHGENFKIPDFHNPEERDAIRNDDLTPFPDENGNGVTLPAHLPEWPGKKD